MRKKGILKKIVALGCTAALVTGCITGCGSSSSEETAGSGDGTLSGSLTVWYNTYSYEDCLTDVIAAFEEKYPDVAVEYEIKADGDYDSLLKTAVQSGSGPDLFWTNGTATTTMSDFANNGVIEDLTDDVDYSFISDDAKELATVDGKLYSVPWMTLDTRTVFYNRDMFKDNNWETPKTFSDFEKLLKDIKSTGTTPISLCYDSWTMLFAYEPILAAVAPEYCSGLADYSVKATDQPAKDAMQKMIDWAEEGYFGDNWFGVTDSSAQTLAFTTGNAAMTIAGSWDAATISQNNPGMKFGAFAIPAEDGTTGLVGTSANGFSVSSDSQNLEAAKAFAAFCATKEAQTIWVKSQGAVSATPEIEASTDIAKEISESGQGNIYASWQSVLSKHSKDGIASTVWAEDFPKIFNKEMTVDKLMEEIAAEME